MMGCLEGVSDVLCQNVTSVIQEGFSRKLLEGRTLVTLSFPDALDCHGVLGNNMQARMLMLGL